MKKQLDIDATVIDLYQSGNTIREIVAHTKVSISTIYLVLDRYGVKRRTKTRSLISQTISTQVQALHSQTVAVKDIALQLDLSVATVYNILDLKAYHHGQQPDDLVSRVIDMRKQGATMRAIGEVMGVSRTTVLNILKANGEA